MNISICITVLNEEKTISALLDSLFNQSKRPNQIVIVDGGSTDKTTEIIRHYQKKYGGVKMLIERCSRARGRNLAVEVATGDIIVMTDAGCVAQKDWVKNITSPFVTAKVDVVAGFYKMVPTILPSSAYHMQAETSLQKAMSRFLGISPNEFDYSFLPSTRSIAFTKKIWEGVGGFPENLMGTAEDTVFNYKLLKIGAKISRVKDAIVEWGMPDNISKFKTQILNYAKGDAKSKIWLFPGKGLASHNIKALFIFFRYLFGFLLFIFCLFHTPLFVYWFIGLFVYLLWAYRKVFLAFGDWKVAKWGPFLQIVSDIAVMSGFISAMTFRK